MKVTIFHAAQDDPKKCTARKMARFGLAELVESPRRIPHESLLLDPFSEKSVSPEDADRVALSGVSAIDCSWERAPETFATARPTSVPRALPYLLAANPVHYGQPVNLSTAEAVAATAFICGFPGDAEKILRLWNWGPQFLALNREPLEAYAACGTSAEVVKVMNEFVPSGWEGGAPA